MLSELNEDVLGNQKQAQIAVMEGRLQEAADLYEQVLALKREALGARHPEVAATLHDLAVVHDSMGAADHARALWAEARDIVEP